MERRNGPVAAVLTQAGKKLRNLQILQQFSGCSWVSDQYKFKKELTPMTVSHGGPPTLMHVDYIGLVLFIQCTLLSELV